VRFFPRVDSRMNFKRRILHHLVFFRPYSFTSVHRGESESNIVSSAIFPYSESSFVRIPDPRNGNEQVHAYRTRKVFKLRNVLVEPSHGNLYSQDGSLIKEATSWDPLTSYLSFPYKPKPFKGIDFDETVIYLRSSSFWHWVIEDLPPFLFLVEKFPDCRVVVAKDPPSYVAEVLAELKMDFIEISKNTVFSEILLVEFGSDSGWPTPVDLQILGTHRLFERGESGSRLVYISRRSSSRSPNNEEAIEYAFASKGFEIVFLEKLDFLSKITLFKETRVLAGVHGAGLVGMVWMPEGSTVLDIANEDYWTESAFKLSNLKKILYKSHVYSGPLNSEVNIDKLLLDFDL
jgi:hypothetical protein